MENNCYEKLLLVLNKVVDAGDDDDLQCAKIYCQGFYDAIKPTIKTLRADELQVVMPSEGGLKGLTRCSEYGIGHACERCTGLG